MKNVMLVRERRSISCEENACMKTVSAAQESGEALVISFPNDEDRPTRSGAPSGTAS